MNKTQKFSLITKYILYNLQRFYRIYSFTEQLEIIVVCRNFVVCPRPTFGKLR